MQVATCAYDGVIVLRPILRRIDQHVHIALTTMLEQMHMRVCIHVHVPQPFCCAGLQSVAVAQF
jgi:hypothetical protein